MALLFLVLLLLVIQQRICTIDNDYSIGILETRRKQGVATDLVFQDNFNSSQEQQVVLSVSKKEQDYFMIQDHEESKHSQYIQDVQKTILEDYANERICFTQLLGNYSFSLPSMKYKVARCIILFHLTNSNNRLPLQISKRTESQLYNG